MTTHAGWTAELSAHVSTEFAEPPEQQFESPDDRLTYEDIPLWCTTYYDDKAWLVHEKGDDVSPEPGEHIVLWALHNEGPEYMIIHEKWIDSWLEQKRKIHFNVWDAE